MKVSQINIYKIQKQSKTQPKEKAEKSCTASQNRLIYSPSFSSNIHYTYDRNRLIDYLEQNPSPKAQGTDGIIYKFGDNAVKVAKTRETSFAAEAEILKKLPKSLRTAQDFIDRFEYRGKDVLVSSFVEGTHKKALTPNDISKIFDVILAHDKENIIHGDLNLGNIIFSRNGDISFIDYGAATQPTTTQVELYPSFVVNTNALKFENTGINDSIKVWEKEGTFEKNFRQYLSKKADFYGRHTELVSDERSLDYENNLAIVLKSPTKEIIEAELTRIKILDLLEQADTATNYDNNPYLAIELWNKTVDSALEYELYTSKKIEEAIIPEEQKYFTYQNETAKCFKQTLTEWRNGTLSWLYEIKNPNFTPRSDVETNLKKNWNL